MSTLFIFALKISLIFHGGKNEGGNAVAPVLAKWNDLISKLWHKRYGDRRAADLGHIDAAFPLLDSLGTDLEGADGRREEFLVEISPSYTVKPACADKGGG